MMKYLLLVLLVAFALVPNTALAQTNTDSTSVTIAKQAIRHQFKRFAKALERGDANTIADIYASDAVLLLPNIKPIEGRVALRALFAQGFEQFDTVSYKYTVQQIEVAGDWAYRWGEATQVMRPKNATAGSKSEEGHLKFIDVWKKGADGSWHIYRDSSVIDMPLSLRKLIDSCVQAKQGKK